MLKNEYMEIIPFTGQCSEGVLAASATTRTPPMFHLPQGSNQEPSSSQLGSQQTEQPAPGPLFSFSNVDPNKQTTLGKDNTIYSSIYSQYKIFLRKKIEGKHTLNKGIIWWGVFLTLNGSWTSFVNASRTQYQVTSEARQAEVMSLGEAVTTSLVCGPSLLS